MRAPDRGTGRHGGQKDPAAALKVAGIFGPPQQAERNPATADADEGRKQNEPWIVSCDDAGENAHVKIPILVTRATVFPIVVVAPEIDDEVFRGQTLKIG